MKQIKTEDAVGAVLCHDITEIVRGVRKGARFRKGHIVKEEDIPVLLSRALLPETVEQLPFAVIPTPQP